jgi:hypothetical protein
MKGINVCLHPESLYCIFLACLSIGFLQQHVEESCCCLLYLVTRKGRTMRLPVLSDRVYSPTRGCHGKYDSKCQQSVGAQRLYCRRPNWHLQVSAPKNGWKEQCQWYRRESTNKGNKVLEEWDSIGHWRVIREKKGSASYR